MCGILATYHSESVAPFTDPIESGAGSGSAHKVTRRFQTALSRLHHRGPDQQDTFCSSNGNVQLGHCRLHITGGSDAVQPVRNEDGSILAIVNGQFYGYQEICNDLCRSGHRISSSSDSEIAVHLYEEYGLRFVEHLRGEFAVVLYDANLHRMVLARDRFGVKPLVYYSDAQQLWVASEAKALHALGVSPEISNAAIHDIGLMQYLPPDRTCFSNILQLPPATLMIRDSASQRLVRYWQMDYPRHDRDEPLQDSEPIGAMIKTRLRAAVADRTDTQVAVGFHLSGGVDSSLLVAIAARTSQVPVRAFGLQFDHADYAEHDLASKTAADLGVDFEPVRVTAEAILEHLDAAVVASEGVAINGHLSAKYLLHRQMHESGIRVVLSGEGADEVFTGYDHLCLDYARQQGDVDWEKSLEQTSRTSRGMMLPLASDRVETFESEQVRGLLAGRVPSFLAAKLAMGTRFQQLLQPDFLPMADPFLRYRSSLDGEQLAGRHPVDQATWLWSRFALAGYILRTLGDGTEMPHSIEGRTPYLDHRIHEVVSRIPPATRLAHRTPKALLRTIAAEYLPADVVSRKKHPLDAPPLSYFATGPTYWQLRDRLLSSHCQSLGFFSESRMRNLLERLPSMPMAERQLWDPPLMLALSLESLSRMHVS